MSRAIEKREDILQALRDGWDFPMEYDGQVTTAQRVIADFRTVQRTLAEAADPEAIAKATDKRATVVRAELSRMMEEGGRSDEFILGAICDGVMANMSLEQVEESVSAFYDGAGKPA